MCVPFAGPTTKYIPLPDLVSSIAPHFAYQLQFDSGNVEQTVRSKDEIKGFLSAMYGGRTEKGEFGFDARHGVFLDKVRELRPSRLLSGEVSRRELSEAVALELTDLQGTGILRR